jgi:predicted RND superfamily exporter protein
MEKIKINSIEKKMTRADKPFWVVKYNDSGDATIGAWDAQLADYIEKDVGIGGTVSVVITQKGDYTNITEVDMTSGVKGEPQSINDIQKGMGRSIRSDKDKSIVALALTKCYSFNANQTKQEVLETYNFFLEKL